MVNPIYIVIAIHLLTFLAVQKCYKGCRSLLRIVRARHLAKIAQNKNASLASPISLHFFRGL